MSVNSTNPKQLFGGEWTQISGRFLYCTTNSKQTGGSETHSHSTGNFTLDYQHLPSEVCVDGNFGWLSGAPKTGVSGWQITSMRDVGWTSSQPHNHGNTGASSNIPPYFTVYCWYRVS